MERNDGADWTALGQEWERWGICRGRTWNRNTAVCTKTGHKMMTSEKTTEKAGDKAYIIFFKTLHEPCCPSLDTLQHPNVSVVRGPELHTALEAPGTRGDSLPCSCCPRCC